MKSHFRSSGVALVVVLASLVLIAAVLVMFLTTVTMERRAASGSQALVSNRQLSDTVVSLVQSQIRQATTRGATIAWASQPGMIRTFSSNGSLDTAYKLYSAADFAVTNSLSANLAADLASAKANWTNSACYADLNAPVTQVVGTQTNIIFPIADPRASGKVDGFSFTTDFGATTNAASPKLPMPVQWIYVLQDGTLVAPASTSSSSIALPGASSTNSAVGRIAYWTDDDSAKVNINTASEATYWDTPRVSGGNPTTGTADLLLAKYQPAKREYQRYPGHPATTSLSPVLFNYMVGGVTESDFKSALYSLLPKYADGGTMAATRTASSPIPAADHALFASVDEMLFSPSALAGSQRTMGFVNRDTLEQTRFFLTASSRAPEVNLFNLPRVSLWPVSSVDDGNHRTPFDRLNLFCSTVGTGSGRQVFAFTRYDPGSLNADFTGRNAQLFDYLQTLMANPFPGFTTATFAQKYPSDYKQILVEITDYIRLANLQDNTMESPTFVPFTAKLGVVRGASGSNVAVPGAGQVVPFRHPATGLQGFGRFPMISEAAVQFIAEKSADTAKTTQTVRAAFYVELSTLAQGYSSWCPDLRVTVSGLDQFQVKKAGDPAYAPIGFPTSAVNYCQVDGGAASSSHTATGGSLGLIPQMLYPSSTTAERGTPKKVKPDTDPDFLKVYPFVSDTFELPPSGSFDFSGGNLDVIVEARSGAGYVEVQRYHFQFPASPSAGWPTPTGYPTTNTTPSVLLETFKDRVAKLIFNGNWGPKALFYNGDVVRSLEANPSDLRLIAPLPDVPATFFSKHINYDTTKNEAHSISGGKTQVFYSSPTFGKLVSGLSWTIPTNPNISSFTAAALNQFGRRGDWDTGVSQCHDGPWINKPDEGDEGNLLDPNFTPYYYTFVDEPVRGTLFSANRQLPSSGMLGSLPTGVNSGKPWQTLLFCPNPAAVQAAADVLNPNVHAGFGLPLDHLLMDLFWVPVTEPYAISDSFATAGKVSLNAQILPFTNVTRETGLIAALKGVKITAVPQSKIQQYKYSTLGSVANNFRYDLDRDATLAEIRKRYLNNGVYLSASQICEVLLIPKSKTSGDNTLSNPVAASGLDGNTVISNFWQNNLLTGDNLREKPYVDLYPRLTTKSNVYTIHYQVQSLKKVPGGNVAGWDEAKDKVVGELRGSSTLERFIDPNDPAFNLPKNNFTQAVAGSPNLSNVPTLDKFYKFRVIATHDFRP